MQQLLQRGATRVYAAARRAAHAASDPRVVPLLLDITDEQQVCDAVSRCGDVQLLVNNAGVNHNSRLVGADDLQWARAEMETNYLGTLAMCRAFAPVLASNGGGAIINVLSIGAKVVMPAMGSLCGSKAAALRMTECVRAELAAQGTRVMAVLPGAVDTPMTRGLVGVPKLAPDQVVRAMLDGLVAGADELCMGPAAERIERLLREDPRALLASLAAGVR